MPLANLVTSRRQVIEMVVAEENRLEHASPAVATLIKEHVAQLKDQLANIENGDAGTFDPRRRRHLFVILLVWCYYRVGHFNPVCPRRRLIAQGNSLRLLLSYLPLILSKLALICLGGQ